MRSCTSLSRPCCHACATDASQPATETVEALQDHRLLLLTARHLRRARPPHQVRCCCRPLHTRPVRGSCSETFQGWCCCRACLPGASQPTEAIALNSDSPPPPQSSPPPPGALLIFADLCSATVGNVLRHRGWSCCHACISGVSQPASEALEMDSDSPPPIVASPPPQSPAGVPSPPPPTRQMCINSPNPYGTQQGCTSSIPAAGVDQCCASCNAGTNSEFFCPGQTCIGYNYDVETTFCTQYYNGPPLPPPSPKQMCIDSPNPYGTLQGCTFSIPAAFVDQCCARCNAGTFSESFCPGQTCIGYEYNVDTTFCTEYYTSP